MAARPPTRIGRYLLFDELASGGMASVHLGRLDGPSGFARTVAIKRLFRTHAEDPGLATLFLDEARIAARINHPNVVPVIDVVAVEGEALLVMEYVHGVSLSEIMDEHERRGTRPPLSCVAQVIVNMLTGLHAAHETLDDDGRPLGIIHRDVSPQNVMVTIDGIGRVVDFGIARAARRLSPDTKEGLVRGKLAYMAPEQVTEGQPVDRRSDVYAAALVMWEALAGKKLFTQEAVVVLAKKLSEDPPPLSSVLPDVPPAVEALVTKGLAHHPGERYATALEMARAIEAVVPPVSPREIAEWVRDLAGPLLDFQSTLAERVRREEAPPADAAPGGALAVLPAGGAAPGASPYVTTKDLEVPTSAFTPARVAAATVALIALVVVLFFAWPRSKPSVGRAPEPEPSASASASASAFASAAASASAPASVPASAAASASASASAAASASASSIAPVPLATPAKAKPKPKTGKNCDPPWRVDDKGVRILKKECF